MEKIARSYEIHKRVVTTILGKQEPRNTQPGAPGLGERRQEEGRADIQYYKSTLEQGPKSAGAGIQPNLNNSIL